LTKHKHTDSISLQKKKLVTHAHTMAFNFMLPLRIAQAFFAIIVLGLNAYGMALKETLVLMSDTDGADLNSRIMVERLENYPVPFADQLPPLHCDLDLQSRCPLPCPLPALLAYRRAQTRHPGYRSRHHGLLACGVSRRGGVSVGIGFLQGDGLWCGEGGGRFWGL
jgi:hypothetical protein